MAGGSFSVEVALDIGTASQIPGHRRAVSRPTADPGKSPCIPRQRRRSRDFASPSPDPPQIPGCRRTSRDGATDPGTLPRRLRIGRRSRDVAVHPATAPQIPGLCLAGSRPAADPGTSPYIPRQRHRSRDFVSRSPDRAQIPGQHLRSRDFAVLSRDLKRLFRPILVRSPPMARPVLRCAALLIALAAFLLPLAALADACSDCLWAESPDCCPPSCCTCCAHGTPGLAASAWGSPRPALGDAAPDGPADRSPSSVPRDIFHIPKPALV